ncbi:MAG: hypothetical protein OEM67_11910 [Thermoleophilia bacterium]|nr:hypothetical protein [Thermoleophilia bacterium]
MGKLSTNINEATNAIPGLITELQKVRAEAEAIVGLQERGARALPSGQAALTVSGSTGGGGGGGLDRLGDSGVIGLLLGALATGGASGGSGRERFQPLPPSLRGATFARSLALGQFR